jgi:hypothetical protein
MERQPATLSGGNIIFSLIVNEQENVERLECSTDGLKEQLIENDVGNQEHTVLCQSLGWIQ